MYYAVFECDLGFVAARYKTEKEVEKAFQWLQNKYKWYNPFIKLIKEYN